MYSVVLLLAVSGGADLPDCHRGHGCNGGGCHGAYAGCHGGGGCNGGGCYGGGCHGGGHRLFGGGHGCHGGRLFGGGHGCHGGGGCYGGGCYGGGCYGGGCYGGGCAGGYGCAGGCAGGVVVPSGDKPKDMPKPGDKPKDKEDEARLAPATLIVSLPAEAKLTIDDATTTSTGAVRTFVSPNLNAGQEYHYTLKTEIAGKPVTKVITVRAGEETRVEM
jgi:uncharacterized protein (TIGR03000 family)